jgi:FKBP-type peptidyl-prolyl cis-trans isomerase SlpA
MNETENHQAEILGNSEVTLHFSLQLPDGTEAISTFGEEPMTITMGDGNFTPGMEMALYGLKEADEQTITLTPEQGYGYPDQQLIHEMPLSDFGAELQPEVGQIIAFTLPNGAETPGLIIETNDEVATVDFNHPLSGHDVVFKVQIIKIVQPRFEMEL